MPERVNYDQAIKWIVEHEPAGLLAWLAEQLHRPMQLVKSDVATDLPAIERLADVVWQVQTASGKQGLLHVEFQTKVEAEIGERVAEYQIRLWRRDHLPVRSVVVFLRQAVTVPTSPFLIPWEEEGDESLLSRFEVIRLWEVPPASVLQTPHPVLWPLAGLMAGITPEAVVTIGEQIVTALLERKEKSELVGLLGLLAGMQLAAASILEAIRRHPMLDEIWQESSVAQAVRAEGRAEGHIEGMRLAVRLALESRFGPLGPELSAALAGADEATLTDILTQPDVSVEQVRARLEHRAGN